MRWAICVGILCVRIFVEATYFHSVIYHFRGLLCHDSRIVESSNLWYVDLQPFLDIVRVRELIHLWICQKISLKKTNFCFECERILIFTKLNGRTRTYCRHNLRQFRIINKCEVDWLVKFTKFWLRKFYSNKVTQVPPFLKTTESNCINYSQKKNWIQQFSF